VETLQPDPRRAREFYTGLFGWETHGAAGYHVARVRGRNVAGIGRAGRLATPAWITRVRVASVDETVTEALHRGGSLTARPVRTSPSGRLAVLSDPGGAPFAVWETDAGHGAELVNEPESWDLSTLRTHSPERAEVFYGALFGWQAEPFGAITLWRLPGYVGGLEEQPVPRDTVAIMTTLDGVHTRPEWGVDFRVRDADASADLAVRLGGAILEAPHDMPGFRTALLADPQGAAFSISQFV
jgi:predicted enzyme related to lactoylglutathione lyase